MWLKVRRSLADGQLSTTEFQAERTLILNAFVDSVGQVVECFDIVGLHVKKDLQHLTSKHADAAAANSDNGDGGVQGCEHVELIPGGSEVAVNVSNVHDYVRKYAEYRMVKAVNKPLEVMCHCCF